MAELVSIKRNVDVSPGQAAPAVFHCSQGDVGSKIILGLLNNGTAYAIPSGVTVTIEGSESNGSIFTPISATVSGSDITFYLTGEMTAVAGPAICQAVLKSGSNILGTANFTLEVESSPMGADAPPVFTDAGWTWMLNKLNTEFVPALGNETIIDAIESKADQSNLTALSNTVAGHTGSITALNNSIRTINNSIVENRRNIDKKLDKDQGTANAGKYLKVGADGNVETADLDVTTDKTLSIADKAADAKAVGDELTVLKADLSETGTKTETVDYTTVSNEWVTSAGLIQSRSGWNRTDYIDLTDIAQFKVNFATNYASYFDKEKNPAGGIRIKNNVMNDVPANAAYAMVSQTSTAMNNLVITAVKRRAINKIENDINNLKEQIENIDIETDTTLSISGKPADAKAVGDELQNFSYYGIKGPIYCIECSDLFTFAIGTIINGIPNDADKKKVRTETFVTLNYDLILLPYGDIRFAVVSYDATGETLIKDSGWQTAEYIVPAGQNFKLVIARPNGAESVLNTKHELLKHLYIVDSYYSLRNIVDNSASMNRNAIYKMPFMQSAHRGIGTTILRPNTKYAFLEAAQNGFDAVEFDVRKTSDNVIIISHDSFVKGTLNGESVNLTIENETYDTLKQINIGSHYAYGDQTICSLEEALEIVWKYSMYCFIDHKISIPLETAAMVKKFNLEGKAFYSNFTMSMSNINGILEIDPLARFSTTYYQSTLETLKTAGADMSKFAVWCAAQNITDEIRDTIKDYGCMFLLSSVNSDSVDKISAYHPDIVEYATLSCPQLRAIQKTFRDEQIT